jgi:hypothetical protein
VTLSSSTLSRLKRNTFRLLTAAALVNRVEGGCAILIKVLWGLESTINFGLERNGKLFFGFGLFDVVSFLFIFYFGLFLHFDVIADF